MAKQRGIVFLEGTMGGINFYYRKGVAVARTAGGGFTRAAIKKSPSMERVRENNSEFGACSLVNKLFKQSFRPFVLGYKDGGLHSSLMKLFLQIKDCDLVSIRGKRRVAQGMTTAIGKKHLQDFVFTPKRAQLLPCHYAFDWDTLKFEVSGFDVSAVGFPKEAHYMELLFGVVRFDFDTLSYTQVITAPLVVERDFAGSGFSVSVPELPSGSGLLYAMARVAFYQDVNGKGYLLSGGGAFGLEIVGVRS